MTMVTRGNRWALGVAALCVAVAATTACGKSEEQKRAEEAARAVEEATRKMEAAGKKLAEAGKQAGQGSEEMAKGLEAMAKGLGALAGGDAKAVEPVSFRELQTVFPDVPGWEKGKPTGEKTTVPVSYSQAKVVYRKGESRIDVTLVDSGFNQLLLLPYTWITNSGYEKETERGYEKAVKIAGHPGLEKWDSEGKDGEVNAFVHKRFILQIEGRHIDDTKVLHQFAEAADLTKLATLK
jgi:hypothetical protein